MPDLAQRSTQPQTLAPGDDPKEIVRVMSRPIIFQDNIDITDAILEDLNAERPEPKPDGD